MCNKHNLDIFNINAHTKFHTHLLVGHNLSISFQDTKQKNLYKVLTLVKGHNAVTTVRKMMCKNLNLDLVNINA